MLNKIINEYFIPNILSFSKSSAPNVASRAAPANALAVWRTEAVEEILFMIGRHVKINEPTIKINVSNN